MTTKKLMQAAGSASDDKVYVEDVFSTNLYTGNNSAQTITTGLDISGEGGTIWFKQRVNTESHRMLTTTSGTYKYVQPDTTDLEYSVAASNGGFGSVTSTGFTLVADDGYSFNKNNKDMVAWSFRKQEGFFDVVTYTGDGNTSQTINHNLGCKPGMIIIKLLDSSGYDWPVWHKSLGANYIVRLNLTAAANNGATSGGNWNSTAPTSTQFTVGSYGQVNNNGSNFIAYLFADGDESAAQIFGDDGDEAIVKCGTFTTSSTWGIANAECGFEPQWLMYKRTDDTEDWQMIDNMRGCATKQGKWNGTDDGTQYSSVSTSNDQVLKANTSAAEANEGRADFHSTGFSMATGGANDTYIYVAIRRGPMKEPSAGTDVYAGDKADTSVAPMLVSNFPVDLVFPWRRTDITNTNKVATRLLGNDMLNADDTSAAYADSDSDFDFQNGYYSWAANNTVYWGNMFRRYPKVFDVVVYSGSNSALTVNHNLGVKPELIICKCTNNASPNWSAITPSISDIAGGSGTDFSQFYFNLTNAGYDRAYSSEFWLTQDVTSTQITYAGNSSGGNADVNYTGYTYTNFLFASLDGISKVGTYSGTGNDVNVTGLGAAARFVLIKRTDDTGDWYVFDTTQGIVSGNDPYVLMNSTSAQVTNTDYIDPHSSGFTITSSAPAGLNASGGTYLYLAFS